MSESHFKSNPRKRPKTHNTNWTTVHRKVSAEELEGNRARIAEIEEAARSGKVQPLEIPSGVSTWKQLQPYLKRKRLTNPKETVSEIQP